jgi:hypothetical protein
MKSGRMILQKKSILVFGALAVGVCLALAQTTDRQVITGLRVPEYDDQGRLKSLLRGDHATIPLSGPIEVQQLKYEVFGSGTQADVRITAPQCLYDREHGTANSTGAVCIARPDMIITGTGFDFDRRSERMVIKHQVRVVLKGARKQEGFIP